MQPCAFVTTSFISYTPGLWYRLIGLVWVEVVPSPNIQSLLLMVLLGALLPSVNTLSAPWQSSVGLTVNAAKGLLKNLSNTCTLSLKQPLPPVALNVTVYEPAVA